MRSWQDVTSSAHPLRSFFGHKNTFEDKRLIAAVPPPPHRHSGVQREWRHLRLLSPLTEEKTLSGPQVASDGVSELRRGGCLHLKSAHL